jgi:hypothetical protein
MMTKKLPRLHELKGVIILLDVIISNFKFVHPLDDNPRGINSFLSTSQIMGKNADLLSLNPVEHSKIPFTDNESMILEKDINQSLYE